jgi:outer membrane receptor protein involved in Fe transport
VPADDPETAVPRIIELVKTRIPKRFGLDPIRDIQVLCPMNRGGIGARTLNIELQAALNPAGERKIERFGWTFAPGDKVMQIENDYDKEVYNGDIGYIEDVDPDDGELTASFDGRTISYRFGELDTLVLAYAGEAFAAFAITPELNFRLDYTFAIAKNEITELELLRRPRNKLSMQATWKSIDKFSLSTTLVFVGTFVDGNRDFSIPRLNAPGYTLVNLAANYEVTENFSAFARIDNLFNVRYQNPIGFLAPGFGIFGGLKVAVGPYVFL